MTQITYRQELLRKSIHLSSLWMPVVIILFPQPVCIILFAVLLAGNILVEYGHYKQYPLFVKTYGRMFGKMLRAKETDGRFHLSGSPYVLGAALAVSVLFPAPAAATAMAVMLVADTAAALIGRPCGRHKINCGTKSLEGAAAFFIAGTAVTGIAGMIFGAGTAFFIKGTIGVFIAAFAEVYENRIHLDDNLSIPLIVGACLTFL